MWINCEFKLKPNITRSHADKAWT